MLTSEDLKQIRKIVREEIEVERENSDSNINHDLKILRLEVSNGFHRFSDKIKDLVINLKN